MRRNFCSCLLLLCLLLTSCGIADPSKHTKESDTGITVVDDLGRSIAVNQPQRAAPLLGSFAQVWMLAGGTVCAAPEDAWNDLNLELSEETVNLGHTKELNFELLLASEPDFILASTNTRQQMEWKETLEATGIPVAYFDISDFDDYLRMLSVCTDITGRTDLYQEHGLAVQEQIQTILEQSRIRTAEHGAPKVLSLVASAANVFAKNSVGNVLGEMLNDLGCVNIADSESSLLEDLNIEYILQEDPDYIFIVQRGDDTEGMKLRVRQMMEEHPAWAQLSAVKNGKIYVLDKMLYNLKPNHRWGEAYEKLERILSNGE